MIMLLCVPYAGGTGQGYARLGRWLRPGIQLAGLDLPGRGALRHQPPADSLDAAISALTVQAQQMMDSAGSDNYGVLGHSLGALLAHALVGSLGQSGLRPPQMLAVSCCVPPHQTGTFRQFDADQLAAMGSMALLGTRASPAQESMRAAATEAGSRDLALLRGVSPATRLPVLNVPVVGIYGSDDPFQPQDSMADWAQWTTASFRLHAVPGGHFCFRQYPEAYARILQQEFLGSRPPKWSMG